ncbi:MAG: hypothetical protein JNL36_06160 [Candidatus Kapabacteria bacterium]|nr:hypothetical protein [Candidatus Kapabacteria bacterium]
MNLQQVERFLGDDFLRDVRKSVHSRVDLTMKKVMITFSVFSLILTVLTGQYVIGLVGTTLFLGSYLYCVKLFGTSSLTRYATGVLLQLFSLLYLFIIQGREELYFFSFLSLSILIFYQEYKVILLSSATFVFCISISIFLTNNKSSWLTSSVNSSTTTYILFILAFTAQSFICMYIASKLWYQTVVSKIHPSFFKPESSL